MVVKKRDFQKAAGLIQEFLSKLSSEESTAELRDSMNLVLFYLQKYYKKLRSRSGTSPRFNSKSPSGSLIFNGGVSPVSPACGIPDQFEWKWYNLESPRLSASLGTNEFSSLPLILQAAKSGDSERLRELIDKDPEVVHQVDGLGRNAVMYCVHGNTPAHTECLEMLINANCDLDHQANDNTTGLHVAAYCNNTTALTLLLRNKASHHIEDNQGRTGVHWAAAATTADNLKLLLQFGGNINAVDSEGLTPAMWACHFDQLQNLQVLQGALSRLDPEDNAIFKDTDCYGQSVIHWSVKGVGSLDCLEALLSPQSAVLKDNDGKTVLHTAAERGNSTACEMILEVRGDIGALLDVDNMKRTPAHLAAICGQGEVVNFLLDQGADLLVKDSLGATAVDYIHNKQLNYCGMVLRAHAQIKEQPVGENTPGTACSDKESHGDHTASSKAEPSAPPFQAIQEQQQNAGVPDEHNRGSICDQNIDVSDLHGFEVQGSSVDMENEQSHHNNKNTSGGSDDDSKKLKEEKKRRQSTLTRQSGFVNDSDSKLLKEGPSLNLRTGDGNVVVVMSDQDVEGDDKEQIINIEEGDIEIDCEDNFGYSSVCLQEGRGSASSVHSEPDNADNYSVSVELSVASLGSDDDEELGDEELIDHSDEVKKQKSRKGEAIGSQPEIISESYESHDSRHPPSHQGVPTSKNLQKMVHLQSVHTENHPVFASDNYGEHEADNTAVASKKKKDKTKKKKQKGASVTELVAPLPPPRGMVPPLNSLGPPGVTKLGVLDPRGIKPAPWEHGSLGPLRQALPEPVPPTSPRMGRESCSPSGEVFDRNESAFERPKTPEPPRRTRDMGAHQCLQPSPKEGGLHDREMGYGPPGPPHGPIAHGNGQALLKSMDIKGRGPKMESWTGKSMGGVVPNGPPGPKPGQQSFMLHGPVPHPPQH